MNFTQRVMDIITIPYVGMVLGALLNEARTNRAPEISAQQVIGWSVFWATGTMAMLFTFMK